MEVSMNEQVQFQSQGKTIQGELYLPEGQAATNTVLLLPGFPNSLEDYLNVEFCQAMAIQGISTFTFSYSGTYQSEGTFSWGNTQEDIQAAFAWLHQEKNIRQYQLNTDNLILGGYSYGGGMGITYTAQHPQVRRVFSIAGTDHGEFAREYLRNPAFAQMIEAWFDEIRLPAGPVNFEDIETATELSQNSEQYDLKLAAPSLADRDILLIAGWDDSTVSIESHILPLYRALVAANAQKVQIIAFQDNHIFENSREQLAQTVVNWILNT
jgi:dipeptidyl aminopeptidase/acylaminoacyl peptidase